MPMPCNLETTIIDNLVICFLAAPTLLAELRDLFGIDYGDFRLSRIEGRFHRHYFNITTPRAKILGSLYFDRFASDGNERYIWLKVVNATLKPHRRSKADSRPAWAAILRHLIAGPGAGFRL